MAARPKASCNITLTFYSRWSDQEFHANVIISRIIVCIIESTASNTLVSRHEEDGNLKGRLCESYKTSEE